MLTVGTINFPEVVKPRTPIVLLIVQNRFRFGLALFKLCAHFPDLRGLLSDAGSQCLDLALLQGYCGLLFFSRDLQVLHGALPFEHVVH